MGKAEMYNLLAHGYFPYELPPPFNTIEFAKVVKNTSVPQEWDKKQDTLLHIHSLPRPGVARRILSIPNPIAYYNLSMEIIMNWPSINKKVNSSPLSKSIPTINHQGLGRYFYPRNNQDVLFLERANIRSGAKYILRADISRFYASIYTHSIPWALHSKEIAKKDHSENLFGNRIDKRSQQLQHGQTIGIPTSPDTSLVIAEIILSSVDKSLKKHNKKIKAFRHIDDYEIAFKSLNEAEDNLALLASLLQEYELELNSQKTVIMELPVISDYPWAEPLNTIDWSSKNQRFVLAKFFDLAFSYHREYKTDHVLKYAITRLRGIRKLEAESWELLQDLIYQSMIIEPTVIRSALSVIQQFSSSSLSINKTKLSDVLNFIVDSKASMQHHNELAWAVWAMINWDIKMDFATAKNVSKVDESCIALLVLDAYSRRLIPRGLDTSKWEKFMNAAALNGHQWLLAYEANINGWLQGGSDYVAANRNFSHLKANKVRFYDSNLSKPIIPFDNIPAFQASITEFRVNKISEESSL